MQHDHSLANKVRQSALELARRSQSDVERRQHVQAQVRHLLEHLGQGATHNQINRHLQEDGASCSELEFQHCYQQVFPTNTPTPLPATTAAPSTIARDIYRVAKVLPQPFTMAQLVLACWQSNPKKFGLDGFPEHPDTHKVFPSLCGQRGLVARGLLVKLAPKLYKVSTAQK